jgi:hydrogenase nickel incorporation protein HypA/HybF
MHEMPFTQAILEMALKSAAGKPIRRIHLRVGWLGAIVPESVQVFFDFLSKGTPAQGAALVFETAPIVLTCRSCGKTIELPHDPETSPRQALAAALRAGCPCRKADLTVTGGLGCDMTGIEVDG